MAQENGAAKKPIITEYLATTLIADTENRIIKLKKDLGGIEPQLEEYKAAYEKLKLDYDVIKTKLDQEDTLLAFLSRQKNGIDESVEFRINRAESHNAMKDREKKKYTRVQSRGDRFTWTEYAIDILRDEKKFIPATELWDMIDIKFDTEKRIKEAGKNVNSLKWGAINACWMANAKSNNPSLATVGDKIGLIDWVDAAGKVKPEYRRVAVG